MITPHVKNSLDQLQEACENLKAFQDEVWRSIDPRDATSRVKKVRFYDALDTKLVGLSNLADDIMGMVEQYTELPLYSDAANLPRSKASNERIVRELDIHVPHTIDEEFTNKRPYGFILISHAFKDIVTWKRLYLIFCQQLAELNHNRFSALPDNSFFVSDRGHKSFSYKRSDLRVPLPIAHGVFAESNHSANTFRDSMKKLMAEFSIKHEELRIYLRQDRDAEKA